MTDKQMKQIQIKGGMIPKVLELLEAKRGGNQPILSFHSSQTANADVYTLYLDDLLDYIKDVKEQTFKDTVKKYHDAVKKMFDNADCCGCIEDRETKYWQDDNDKIAIELFGVEVK